MPAIRIGINPISWSNDDLPALGGETPLSTALSEGKEIGYEGFELNGKFPKDAKGVGDVLRPYDLALVSGWFLLPKEGHRRFAVLLLCGIIGFAGADQGTFDFLTHRKSFGKKGQQIEDRMPPSTRSAAPLVAAERGLHT